MRVLGLSICPMWQLFLRVGEDAIAINPHVKPVQEFFYGITVERLMGQLLSSTANQPFLIASVKKTQKNPFCT